MSNIVNLRREVAMRALAHFRELSVIRTYAPAPAGLSAEQANALVEEGLAEIVHYCGKQSLVALTAAGVAHRDVKPSLPVKP